MSAGAPTLPVEGPSSTFACPRCGLAHPWSPEHAGKTARCGCGHVLKVPAPVAKVAIDYRGVEKDPPLSPDDELPPEIEAELAAAAGYGEGDLNRHSPARDVHVPVALLVIGFLLTVAEFAIGTGHPAAMAAGVVVFGVKLVVGLGLTFAAALVTAKFAGINFGPFWTALLKLAALSLGPSALGDLTTHVLGDAGFGQVGWAVRVVLYWFLAAYLFELDGAQTSAVVAAVAIVKVILTVFLGSLLLFGMAAPSPTRVPVGLRGKQTPLVAAPQVGNASDAESDGE